jgi:[protein-PII] uridylyltransferase
MGGDGLRAAWERTAEVDRRLASRLPELTDHGEQVALVALGGYGRRELTPHAEIELLVLHAGRGLPEIAARLPEAMVRTVDECAADARRSFAAATGFLDARLVAGDAELFAQLVQRTAQSLRRDHLRLRRRLSAAVQRRHATYPPATAAAEPDVVEGRGGLRDLDALRWLNPGPEVDTRTHAALDFFLRTLAAAEERAGQAVRRLTVRRLGERAEEMLGEVYRHARWVAFRLDGLLATPRRDRALGASLFLRDGKLCGERLPALERAPSLGLRAANLVGFAPPDAALLEWASTPGPALQWDASALEQLWLLLRAADWRAWEFLDVAELIPRYLPELASIMRRPSADDLALDTHSFLALRRLHEWTESEDPFARRVWPKIRHRDWVYLAVLLHELDSQAVSSVTERLGLAPDARAAIASLVELAPRLSETATRRDLHDEDLLLDLAARIGSYGRLCGLVLLTAAHDRALGDSAWTPWKVDLLRQLFGVLEAMLRRPGGESRVRSVDQRRERVARELVRRNRDDLLPMLDRLPRRYLLARSPAFVARHLALAGQAPLGEREVRIEARRHRQPGVWDILVVARDRPGLLATVAGVLALRGASVLAADATTGTDGLVLDVFTVTSAYGVPLEASVWPRVAADLRSALAGRLPLRELLARPSEPIRDPDAVQVSIDNTGSQFYSLVEVQAPDQVGLLYRIARTLHVLELDVHHAKVATLSGRALDVFYVRDASGEKLPSERSFELGRALRKALLVGA